MSELDIRYETGNGFRVRVEQDYDSESPEWLWGNDESFLVAFHRQFYYVRDGLRKPEDVERWEEDYSIIPLSAYIHSGVSLYIGTHKRCEWDSGQVGYVLVKKTLDTDATEEAERLVGIWNTYLSGDVWRVVVEKLHCGECDTWEEYESLSCIYGEDGAEIEVQSWKNYLDKLEKEGLEDGSRVTG